VSTAPLTSRVPRLFSVDEEKKSRILAANIECAVDDGRLKTMKLTKLGSC
jgi:hypothetical protein